MTDVPHQEGIINSDLVAPTMSMVLSAPPDARHHPERIGAAASLSALVELEADAEHRFILVPFADCIDALLRPLVLAVSQFGSGEVLLLSFRDDMLRHSFDLHESLGIDSPRWICAARANNKPAIVVIYNGATQPKDCSFRVPEADGIAVFHTQDWTHPVRLIETTPDGGQYLHSATALHNAEHLAVSSCQTYLVLIYDLSSGALLNKIKHGEWWPCNLALGPDGSLVVCDYDQRRMHFVNPESGKIIHCWKSWSDVQRRANGEKISKEEKSATHKWRHPSMCCVLNDRDDTTSLIVADDDFGCAIEEFALTATTVSQSSSPDALYSASIGDVSVASECGGITALERGRIIAVSSQNDNKITFMHRVKTEVVVTAEADKENDATTTDDTSAPKTTTKRFQVTWVPFKSWTHELFQRPLGIAVIPLPDVLPSRKEGKEQQAPLLPCALNVSDQGFGLSRDNGQCTDGSSDDD